LQETADQYKFILVVVDAFTRFTWLFAVKTTSTRETADCLKNIFDTFVNPSELVTDRGTAFTSREFAEFADRQAVRHRKVAVAAPWANGIVERVNRFLKSSLTKLSASASEWKNNLGMM
jgi:transposase InsO family protein